MYKFSSKQNKMRYMAHKDVSKTTETTSTGFNIPISSPMVMAKADKLATSLGISDFEANSG